MTKNINRKVTIYINGREVENTLQSIRNEVVKLEREQRKLPIGSEEYLKKGREIKELKDVLKSQKVEVADLGNSWKDATFKLAEYSNILMGIQTAFQMLDLGIGKIKDLAKDAAALDDAYGQVQKTTGLTHEQVEQLNDLFKKMDTRTSREQLNQLAYEAGKLGIKGVKDVAAFVDASDKINVALGDVLGDGAMVTIGKMAGVYAGSTKELADASGDLSKQMLAIGSAVNELGKLSTANEHYLVDFAGRMGGIAVQAGLSADQVLGFASALDQDMQKVEMSATAFQKFIGQIMKKPGEFAAQAGMAVADFSQLVRTDLNEALFRVLQGFSGKGGYAELVNIFKDLGLDGARAASVISAMSNSIDKIRVAQAAANEQLKSGQSIIGEYDTMNNTRQARAEKAKKRFEEIRIELGNELYPVLISLQRSGTVLMKGVAGTIQLFKEAPALIAPVVAAIIAWNRYRLVSVVTSGKLKNAIKALIGVSKIEAVTAAFQERSEKKLIATKEAARLKSLQSMLAMEKETLARQSASSQTLVQAMASKTKNRVYSLEVQVTEQAARAEQAHAAATKASGAALLAVPWGVIIAALSSLYVIYKKIKESSVNFKIDKTLSETAKAAGEAEGRLLVLKQRMEAAGKGSDVYKKALEELKAEYPEIIAKHTDEEGSLRNLEKAYKDLSVAAKQSVYDRMYTDAVGTKKGELAEQLQKTMSSMGDYIDGLSIELARKGYRKLSEAEISELKQTINSILVELSAGGIDVGNAYKQMNAAIRDASGAKSFNMGFMPTLNKLAKKIKETTKFVDGLKVKMQPTDADPFGLQKKSLEELESELEASQRLLRGFEKASDLGREGFAQKAELEQKKVDALTEAIGRMKKAANAEENAETGSGGSMPAGESAKEREKRLKKSAKEWAKTKQQAEKLISTAEVKAESGLGKVADEVAAKFDRMRESIVSTAVAAGKMKIDDDGEIVSMTQEVADVLEGLSEAETRWKSAQIDAYIKKMTDELVKQQGKLKETDANGNEYLNKMKEAQRKLVETFTTYDSAILQAQADIESLQEQQGTASDAEEKNIESQIAQLTDLINKYKELKVQMQARVFDAIGTSNVKATKLSGDESQWRTEVQSAVNDKKSSGLGIMFKQSDFDAYGKALESIWQKYEKQKKAIAEAMKANSEMIGVLRDQAMSDPENSLLQEKISLREKENERLQEQADNLDNLRDAALRAAEDDTFGSAIDRWVSGIQQFGDMATSIWGNINKILDNISQKSINNLKDQREAATKDLDDQLEEGILSQEEYNEQKESLDKEYDEKEKALQLEQWKRQQALNVGQAVMQGALAVLQALASPPPPYNAALAAIAATLAAVQIAAIATEPAPYAKGGYVPRRTVFQAGEAGEEWVASNSLLSDPATAPIIEQLEAYQRGNRRALADIPMSPLNLPAATQAAAAIGRSHVIVHDIEPSAWQNRPTPSTASQDRMVELLSDLSLYMKDPRNRQAVISRRTMEDFEDKESFLRNRARL